MKKDKFVLITGACGGIGSELVSGFTNAGYKVIATDVVTPPGGTHHYFVHADLEKIASGSTEELDKLLKNIEQLLDGHGLVALINNAAAQVVKPCLELTLQDWHQTLSINTIAPFWLTQQLFPLLQEASGSVVNVSSIHAKLTKKNFVAYAASKAALSSLTRSMGLELGKKIRINAISPAAVDTSMLKAGFNGNKDKLQELGDFHPVGRIAHPKEIADLALFLISQNASFINGAVFDLDGGISSRLYDPA